MLSTSSSSSSTRFDARLSPEQKDLLQRAARLGGFRSLSDFVMSSAQEKAHDIIEQHNSFLLSEKDREIFFNALMSPPEPNEALKKAARLYKEALGEK
jgi:uncharacterized protein (DUF1778 family)